MKRFSAAIALAGIVLSGCDSGPAAGSGGTIVEPTATTSTESFDPAPEPAPDTAPSGPEASSESAIGTRGNPAPLGSTAKVGDWELRITDVTLDAAEIIKAENMYNDDPIEGRSFVLWTVAATYTGSESGTAFYDLDWKIVGAAGNSFGTGTNDYCGSLPNSLSDSGEAFPGAIVVGNVCISAETTQLSGATILVEETFGGSRTFFALP